MAENDAMSPQENWHLPLWKKKRLTKLTKAIMYRSSNKQLDHCT